MVLPAPAADPGVARARVWLAKLIAQLERSRGGVLVALTGANPTQLGPVVRALSPITPWDEDEDGALEVCLRAEELLHVPAGARVLLRVRPEDIEWLNLQRPIFVDRALRAVLWVDQPALDALVRGAVDLFDWVSRVVPVPAKALPELPVEVVRWALAAGEPFAWTGSGLDGVLRAAGCEKWFELHAQAPIWDLLEALAKPGLPIVGGLRSERDAWRFHMALAMAGRSGAWVARVSTSSLPGMWNWQVVLDEWDLATQRLRDAGWKRPALLAAWLELDRETIEWFAEHPGARTDACDLSDAAAARVPPWTLVRYTKEVEIARALVRSQDDVPEDVAVQVLWSRASAAWDAGHSGAVAPRLVRGLWALGQALPSAELVAAATEAGFDDVGAALALRRWDAGAKRHADELARWLEGNGQSARALEVALEWRARAREDGDERSLAAAQLRLGELHDRLGDAELANAELEASLAAFRSLATREREDPELARQLAFTLARLGELHEGLGALEQARLEFEEAVEIRRELAGDEGAASIDRHEFAVALAQLGGALVDTGELDRAQGHLEDARARITGLIESEKSSRELTPGLVLIFDRLGELHRRRGELTKAKEFFTRCQALVRATFGEHPEHPGAQETLRAVFGRLGGVHAELGEHQLALRHFSRSNELTQELATREPARIDRQLELARSLRDLADAHRSLGDPVRAREHLEESLQISREALARAPGKLDLAWEVAACLEQLGELHHALGDLELAARDFEESLVIYRALAERQPIHTRIQLERAITLEQLGLVLDSLGRPIEARGHFEDALDALRALHHRSPEEPRVTHELAFVLATLGDEGERVQLLEEALQLLEQLSSREVLSPSYEDLFAVLRAQVLRDDDS